MIKAAVGPHVPLGRYQVSISSLSHPMEGVGKLMTNALQAYDGVMIGFSI